MKGEANVSKMCLIFFFFELTILIFFFEKKECWSRWEHSTAQPRGAAEKKKNSSLETEQQVLKMSLNLGDASHQTEHCFNTIKKNIS